MSYECKTRTCVLTIFIQPLQSDYPKGAGDTTRIYYWWQNLNNIRYANDTVLMADR